MTLAHAIFCNVGNEVIELRPTLRHALSLARREGSFAKLIADIEDGSLDAALTIIGQNYPIDQNLVLVSLNALTEPLLTYVLECAGLNDALEDKVDDSTPNAKPVSFEDHLTSLFKIATGWIGWTPQQAWEATPSEIIGAYQGRTEMLKAIFGGTDEPEPADTSELFKTVFNAMGTVKVERPE
jgi:hypothetical protein